MTPRRITRITAENFMRLKAIDISPEGDVVYITGANGEGKSSILNAICAALNWRDVSGDIPEPIHKGKNKAIVSIDLGESGSPPDMTVTRTWTPAGTQLKVESKEGAVFKSPQAMLDKFFSRVGFDPLEFIRMQPKEQRQTLMDLLGIDFSELEIERAKHLQDKNQALSLLKSLEMQIAGLPECQADTPDQEVSATDIINQIQEAQAVFNKHLSNQTDLKTLELHFNDTRARILKLEEELAKEREILRTFDSKIMILSSTIEATILPDIAPLQEQLKTLEETNRAIRVKKQKWELQSKYHGVNKAIDEINNCISCIDQDKKDALESAKFPVKGLSFDESGVIFNGIPLKQASSAEQIRVSLAIGISMNPSLKVLLIRDGSLMDTNTRAIVADLAAKHGMQVWIEAVDESGKVGFTIDDGTVRPPVDPVQQVIA